MTLTPLTRLLEGDAASFKGGRGYVHGTDLVNALDAVGQSLPGRPVLERVEFVQPLQSRGCLHIGPLAPGAPKRSLSAVGRFADAAGRHEPFIIFPTPLPVDDTGRGFDEDSVWRHCTLDAGTGTLVLSPGSALNFAEQLSSAMKRLCQGVLPQHESWWFVRLAKASPLPEPGETVELAIERITAERLVSASIKVGGAPFGKIDFVGGRP